MDHHPTQNGSTQNNGGNTSLVTDAAVAAAAAAAAAAAPMNPTIQIDSQPYQHHQQPMYQIQQQIPTFTAANLQANNDAGPPRTDAVNAIMGGNAPSAVSAKKASNTDRDDISVLTGTDTTYDENRRNRAGKSATPHRKVLVAKREYDAATTFVSNKRDLADLLSEEDCLWLSRNFWIFTEEQLRFAFRDSKSESMHMDSTDDYYYRDEIVKKLVEDAKAQGEDDEAAAEAKAEKTISEWQDALFKEGEKNRIPKEKAFNLEGATSVLLPPFLQHFLSSINSVSVHDFLSLKKTETGAICDMFDAWRSVCNLPAVNKVAIAKYLLGVSFRIETALSSVPPVSPANRVWMSDSIVVLTGAARDFLVEEQGLRSAADFVNTKTKDLSVALVDWRIRKGMPPLKGSGKVAMISGWKAMAKEALDVDQYPGRKVDSSELEAVIKANSSTSPDQKSRAKKVNIRSEVASPQPLIKQEPQSATPAPLPSASKKRGPPEITRHGQYALHSHLYVEDILGTSTAAALSNAGFKTAAQIFDAKTSPEDPMMKLLQSNEVGSSYSPEGTLDQWCQKLYDGLLQFSLVSSSNKRVRLSTDHRDSLATPASELNTRRQSQPRDSHDPFNALSSLTRRFLRSIGVNSAEEFLSMRTTDIAHEFVTFRKNEGKPELKGLGAIASVSGWKAACRRAAREIGMEGVAVIEPNSRYTSTPVERKLELIESEGQRTSDSANDDAWGNTVDDTSDRMEIACYDPAAPDVQYKFELSLRRPNESSPLKWYLTYNGASSNKNHPLFVTKSDSVIVNNVPMKVLLNTLTNKVSNKDKVDTSPTFYSSKENCGLVSLSKFDVRHHESQSLDTLKTYLKHFLDDTIDTLPELLEDLSAHNIVFSNRSITDSSVYIYIKHPMEHGQCSPLVLPTIDSILYCDAIPTINQMLKKLLLSISVLCDNDVKELLKYLSTLEETVDKDAMTDATPGSTSPAYMLKLYFVCQYCLSIHRLDVDGEGKGLLSKLPYNRSRLMEVLKRSLGDGESFDCGTTEPEKAVESFVKLLLEEDVVCRKAKQEAWCETAQTVYENLVQQFMSSFFDEGASVHEFKESFLSTYRECVSSTLILDHCTFMFKNDSSTDEPKKVVVCKSLKEEEGEVIYLSMDEARDQEREPYEDWYRGLQKQIAESLLVCFMSVYDLAGTDPSTLQSSVESATPIDTNLPLAELLNTWPANPGTDAESYKPHAYQIFLALVWPALRRSQWRLVVESDPTQMLFVSPGSKEPMQERLREIMEEREKIRLELSTKTAHLGYGKLPKLSKRLFVQLSTLSQVNFVDKNKKEISVTYIFLKFKSFLERGLTDQTRLSQEIIVTIIKELKALFDTVAPYMFAGSTIATIVNDKPGDADPCDKYGFDAFLQFLLVLPALMKQSNLDSDMYDKTMSVAKEMLDFITTGYSDLLRPEKHLPMEKYARLERLTGLNLKRKLRELTGESKNSQGDGPMKEAILDDDKHTLTDFIVVVMEQIVPCVATDDDVKRKYRRVSVGFPGLMCRHCRGIDGEGRYFFTSLESITTASTVFEKHLGRCRRIPDKLKEEVVKARSVHSEQRRMLRTGSQQAYFNRLWDRLRSANIETTDVEANEEEDDDDAEESPDVVTTTADDDEDEEEKVSTKQEKATDVDDIEFSDHLAVLDHVRTTEMWKGDKTVQEAVDNYYKCLEYGGSVVNTAHMPPRYSSEWVISKRVPKRFSTRKPLMPG